MAMTRNTPCPGCGSAQGGWETRSHSHMRACHSHAHATLGKKEAYADTQKNTGKCTCTHTHWKTQAYQSNTHATFPHSQIPTDTHRHHPAHPTHQPTTPHIRATLLTCLLTRMHMDAPRSTPANHTLPGRHAQKHAVILTSAHSHTHARCLMPHSTVPEFPQKPLPPPQYRYLFIILLDCLVNRTLPQMVPTSFSGKKCFLSVKK